MNNSKYILLAILTCNLCLYGCKKDQANTADNSSNKISNVIADNFNLSLFNTGLSVSGLRAKLFEPGPFTVIAPSDDAFTKAGYPTTVAILGEVPARISAIMNYHILNGNYELNKLPFLFNQEIRSSNGGKLFVTHWVKGADTVLTINGSTVLAQNVPAANGLIQVVNRVLEPYTYQQITDAIASDKNLSLFYQAIQRAGLTDVLNSSGPYSVFAPGNAAMIAYGFPTLAAVNQADPATLKALIRYHIVNERRFIYDYVLSTGTSNQSQQAMLDGNLVKIQLIPDNTKPGSFSGISLQGTGNTTTVQLTKQDVLTGNGVLHTIDGVLKITQ
ncbi:fasciclin domain-containing protein [Mucilaginibacter paludis]|uniref:Beta-Ig-H3/fasciclin n=1 Tax=Mucilaginibacter paludis DSM 18603 TaxID=714943 RepID=H1YBN2_9SPHI|nr:fasciclin domain-containing protein [Mucilaginibacter paludis]EHQ25995.1 beta-Ig-H3/fasciclin [Mucilaginibacter paludis DSM 18603]